MITEVHEALLECGLLPLFYDVDIERAIEVTLACQRGGAQLVEFASRGEDALDVFRALRELDLAARLGAGSVEEVAIAESFIEAGAEFIVGTGYVPAIMERCQQANIPYVPGCATPTEMVTARQAGAEVLEIFPAIALGGPRYIRAVLAALTDYKLMPTGGVFPDRDAVFQWIGAGSACLSMGSGLLRRTWIDRGRYDLIEKAVHDVITWVHEARDALL